MRSPSRPSQRARADAGEPCREGRLVHGDMIGLNKFLLRFSNQALEVPSNLQAEPEQPKAPRPKEVQRTVHLDANSAQALAELAKQHIARQRAEIAARGGESLHAMPAPERPGPPEPMAWEEPEGSGTSMAVFVGALVLGGALVAALLLIVF